MLAIGCCSLISAQSETAVAVTFNIEGAPSQTVILAEIPKITFDDIQMIVSTVDGNDIVYPLDKVESYYFSAVQSGIEDIVSEDGAPALRVRSGSLSVKNLLPGSSVTLYNVQGIVVAGNYAGNDGVATVDTSSLDAGVYIVNYGECSTKIVKR